MKKIFYLTRFTSVKFFNRERIRWFDIYETKFVANVATAHITQMTLIEPWDIHSFEVWIHSFWNSTLKLQIIKIKIYNLRIVTIVGAIINQ